MYFPTTSAKVLRPSCGSTPHDLPALPNSLNDLARLGGAHDEVLIDMACQQGSSWRSPFKGSKSRKLAAVLGGAELSIWSIRPALLLCKLKRTSTSLRRHGLNKKVAWVDIDEPGLCTLVVLTTKGFVFQYSLTSTGPANTPVYTVPTTGTGAQKGQFVVGSGEGIALPALVLEETGCLDYSELDVVTICATPDALILSTADPPAIHSVDYRLFSLDIAALEDEELAELEYTVYVSELPWIVDPDSSISEIVFNTTLGLYVFIALDGRTYAVKDLAGAAHANPGTRRRASSASSYSSLPAPDWDGQCFYGVLQSPEPDAGGSQTSQSKIPGVKVKAVSVAFNDPFSLVSLGLSNGQCAVYSILMPSQAFMHSHQFSLRSTLKSTAPHLDTGPVTCQTWTSDGYALAVGWRGGWSIWTVYGKLTSWAVGSDAAGSEGGQAPSTFEDRFMSGVYRLFWAPGNLTLFALCLAPDSPKERAVDEQLFAIPFTKSAVTSLHTPDNTNHAFLQLDDGLLVYRGADQPDMSVINPESDVWQSIKIPSSYLSKNWPIRHACISSDARLIAVAGRTGFTHYNSLSGRWKLFDNEAQEQSFKVKGGMQWYGSTLIVATEAEDEEGRSHNKLRLFARDRPLNTAYVLDEEAFPSRIVLTSLFDSSLLVYTEDNTFYHFLLVSGKDGPRLRLCGSIGFEGVVNDPRRVRGLSWMVPKSQQRFGDPSADLNFATVIFLIEGKLVLLRPSRAIKDEVKYDLQILADRIEFYWTHLTGIGTLENSLWGWDGERIRIWLNALTIDGSSEESPDAGSAEASHLQPLQMVEESLAINIDFYPLSVLMEKGIIVGVEHEISYRRSLDFAIFRLITTTHLFIHHVLRFHLSHAQIREAVIFASHYQHLVYFAHALEILLHAVLEDEADSLPSNGSPRVSMSTQHTRSLSLSRGPPVPEDAVLPTVVDFLDYFAESLQVVVNCARKTEITRWGYLFQFVGKPRDLFEKCMHAGHLKIAASYLLVLHNLEPLEQSSRDTVRLLKAAMARDDWQLCQELSRFLFSLDHTGEILHTCLDQAGALPSEFAAPARHSPDVRTSAATSSTTRQQQEPNGIGFKRSVSVPVTLSEAGQYTTATTTGSSLSSSPIDRQTLSTSPTASKASAAGASPPAPGSSGPASSNTAAGPTPFMRTGSTARAMHYRMASGSSGLGLGTMFSRVGTPPNERLLRPLSRRTSSNNVSSKDVSSKDAAASGDQDVHAGGNSNGMGVAPLEKRVSSGSSTAGLSAEQTHVEREADDDL